MTPMMMMTAWWDIVEADNSDESVDVRRQLEDRFPAFLALNDGKATTHKRCPCLVWSHRSMCTGTEKRISDLFFFVKRSLDKTIATNTYAYIYIHTHTYIYTYIYSYMCACGRMWKSRVGPFICHCAHLMLMLSRERKNMGRREMNRDKQKGRWRIMIERR